MNKNRGNSRVFKQILIIGKNTQEMLFQSQLDMIVNKNPQPDPHQNLLIIEDNTNQGQKYLKGNFLGKGGFARCYELINEKTKKVDAVKIVQKCSLTKPRSKQKLMNEIKTHMGLRHQHIVELKHSFEDNDNFYLVLEICKSKTLNELLKRKKRLTQSEIKYYMRQLLEAMEYFHGKQVIHRDLKLGNLFLNENMQIKVGDFGLSSHVQFAGERKKTTCGTPNYIAPEILEGSGHSYEVDLWSFGVILFTLVCGRPPFESKNNRETYKKIKAGFFYFPENLTISPNLKQLILNILQKDPHKRPTIHQIKNSDFFVGVLLAHKPSISFRAQTSVSIAKDENQLSDNAKMLSNHEMASKEKWRQKSQEKFLLTDRSTSSFRNKLKNNLKRINSQRILKENPENEVFKRINTQTEFKKFNENSEFLFVTKWVDYSNKYGIGYYLNNGSFGVYFNDSSKMLAFNSEQFIYIEKIAKEDSCKSYRFNSHPIELKKKVSLFGHFKSYINTQYQNCANSSNDNNLVYVRRWFRAKHGVIFRLSNKSVQVIFVDQSQVLISSERKKILFKDKNGQKSEHWISQVTESGNRQLIKRFEYTKQVLSEMTNIHRG